MNRALKLVYFVIPDPRNASLGQRIRFMRKSLGWTQEDLRKKTGVHTSVLTRLERDKTSPRQAPRILGRVLPALRAKFKQAFPETNGDPFDFVYPPTSFGGWLRNLRARRGLRLRELAAALGVKPFTVIRYERNETRPDPAVQTRLKRAFRLNGELDKALRLKTDKRRL